MNTIEIIVTLFIGAVIGIFIASLKLASTCKIKKNFDFEVREFNAHNEQSKWITEAINRIFEIARHKLLNQGTLDGDIMDEVIELGRQSDFWIKIRSGGVGYGKINSIQDILTNLYTNSFISQEFLVRISNFLNNNCDFRFRPTSFSELLEARDKYAKNKRVWECFLENLVSEFAALTNELEAKKTITANGTDQPSGAKTEGGSFMEYYENPDGIPAADQPEESEDSSDVEKTAGPSARDEI